MIGRRSLTEAGVLTRELQVSIIALFAVTAAAGCGARAIGAGDLPEPGQAVAFAQVDVAGIRMSRLVIREAAAGDSKPGTMVSTIKAGKGRHTYAVYLAPGQYAVTGVLRPSDIRDGIPAGRGGALLFTVAPRKASYFGTFRPLTESGMTLVADLGRPAFAQASKAFARKYPVLKAGFEIVNAVAVTDVMKPAPAVEDRQPTADRDPSFAEEWEAAP